MSPRHPSWSSPAPRQNGRGRHGQRSTLFWQKFSRQWNFSSTLHRVSSCFHLWTESCPNQSCSQLALVGRVPWDRTRRTTSYLLWVVTSRPTPNWPGFILVLELGQGEVSPRQPLCEYGRRRIGDPRLAGRVGRPRQSLRRHYRWWSHHQDHSRR